MSCRCAASLGLLRAHRERPRGCGAAEHGYQLPPSDGDPHVPLPREGAQRTISCREYAVIAVRALLTELCLDTQSGSQKVPPIFLLDI